MIRTNALYTNASFMNAMFMQAALANLRIPEVEISGDGEEIPYDYDLVNDPHRVLCGLCMHANIWKTFSL